MTKKRLLLLLFGLLAPFLMLELLLRVLPVSTRRLILPVNDQNPVMRYVPGQRYVYSRDWDFGMANRGRINNTGFVNDQDYNTEIGPPLLAVVGDSYIEAVMVPWPKTLTGLLQKEFAGKLRVYSFAFSGSSLADYLAYAEYARDHFHPTYLVVLIINNDYDECLPQFRTLPGFHYFRKKDDGFELAREDYTPEKPPALDASALYRYCYYNLHWYQKAHPESVPVQVAPAERIKPCQEAVNYFLGQLPKASGLEPGHIVILMDGLRWPEDDSDWKRQFEVPMRAWFLETAAAMGYVNTIDLEPTMARLAKTEQVRFSEKRDFHWNWKGHQTAFDELMATGILQKWTR